MDASHFPSTLTTNVPIASGSMVHDEEQAGWPSITDPHDDVDWTGFPNFFTQVMAGEESLEQLLLSVEYPDCFVLDESLPISDSPLPSYIELGPEWGGEQTAATASDPPEEPHTLSISKIVRDEYTSGTQYSTMDHPDLCLSLSTLSSEANPSYLYPTPRSLSPPSHNSPSRNYTTPQQPNAVAGPSTWKLYSSASNAVPTPLAQDTYAPVVFGPVATSPTWDSMPKKKRRLSRHTKPYTASRCPQPAMITNTQFWNEPEFLRKLTTACQHKLAAGTHEYVPMKPVTVATRLAPLYKHTVDVATTFFGLQRISPPPDALHQCPHTSCSATLRIEDFPTHYKNKHSDWDHSACHEDHHSSFHKADHTNGTHGASCRRQIVCNNRTHCMILDQEGVKKHVLEKHLKLNHIECPHCPSVLISMDTIAGHFKTCRQLEDARLTSTKDGFDFHGGNDSKEEVV